MIKINNITEIYTTTMFKWFHLLIILKLMVTLQLSEKFCLKFKKPEEEISIWFCIFCTTLWVSSVDDL